MDGDIQEERIQKEPKNIRKYDFKTANKFTKDHIRILSNVYEYFVQVFSSYLTGVLRTTCQLELLSVEEQTYADYVNSLQSPVIMAILDMPPMEGQTMIKLSPSIAYNIIDRLLGGNGGAVETSKPFTDIDIALITKIFHVMAKPSDEAWARVLPVKTSFVRTETNPQFAQIVSYTEPTAIVVIKVTLGDGVEGYIDICIPHISIKSVDEKMEKSMWTASKKASNDTESVEYIKGKMLNTNIEVAAKFKPVNITLKDFMALEEGDVLKLSHNVNEPLNVYVSNIRKFKAKLGVFERKYALKITKSIPEEESCDE